MLPQLVSSSPGHAAAPGSPDVRTVVAEAVARFSAAAPGFEVAVSLRCPVTRVWQVAGTANDDVPAVAQALRAAMPFLARAGPLAHVGDRSWHLPLRAHDRLTGCVTLIAERERQLPAESAERLCALAHEWQAALQVARDASEATRQRRLRAALRELPRLFLAASAPHTPCELLVRALRHIDEAAVVTVFLHGEVAAERASAMAGKARALARERFAGDAARLGRAVLEPVSAAVPLSPNARQLGAVPVRSADGSTCGAVVLDMPLVGRAFDAADFAEYEGLGNVLSLGLDLHRTRRSVRAAADLDPETGCLTSDSFRPVLRAALAHAKEHATPTALILLRLTAPRSQHSGRILGERLNAIAQSEGMAVARLSSAEFAVLAERRQVREARLLAGRLRLLAQHGLGSDGASACAGVAVADEGEDCEPRQLFESARRALQQAAAEGPDGQVLARAKTTRNGETPRRTTAAERLEMLRTLARIVDEQHRGGVAHSAAVARRAREVSVELGLPPQEVERVALAGELHDIGRALIPLRLFADEGAEARTVRRRHAVLSALLVRAAGFPAVAALIAALHCVPDEAADAEPAARAARALAIASRFGEAIPRAGADAASPAAVPTKPGAATLVGLNAEISAVLAAASRAWPLPEPPPGTPGGDGPSRTNVGRSNQ